MGIFPSILLTKEKLHLLLCLFHPDLPEEPLLIERDNPHQQATALL